MEVVSQKRAYQDLEGKIRQVESRSMQTSKDLQDVYQELTQAKSIKSEIESEN